MIKDIITEVRIDNMKFLTKLLNQNLAANILNSVPIGISITTDISCKEVRHNRKAAEFLRIKPWDNLAYTNCENYPAKLFHKGKRISPDDMPLQRACWHGKETKNFEIEFIWDDGVSKTLVCSSSPLFGESGSIIGAVTVFEDITECKQTREKNNLQKAITNGINRIFHEALTCETEEELAMTCLNVAQELTRSKFGFIGEENTSGHFDDIAISDPGWAACRMPIVSDHGKQLKGFIIRGLYGRVLRDGKSMFTNDPSSHPDSTGLPDGHPPLDSFLGAPLIQGGKTIGIIALGNKEGGYSTRDMEALEGLTQAMVQALMRKRAELSLRDSEERLRLALEGAEAGMWSSDSNGRWKGTPRLNKLFGRSMDDPPLGEDECFSLIHPEDLPRKKKSWKAALEKGGKYEQEYRVLWPDGSLHWLICKGRVLVGAGRLPRFEGVTLDITKRKQADEVLKRDRQQLEELVRERTRKLEEANHRIKEIAEQLTQITDNMTDIIIKVDTVGTIQYLSPSYEKTMGYPLENRLGGSIFNTLHPEDAERVMTALEKGIKGQIEQEKMECRCRRADGQYLWLEGNGRMLLDENGIPAGAVICMRDISDRKMTEAALRHSEEGFSKIFHNSPDMVAIINMEDGKYLEVNQKFLDVLEYTREEVLGHTTEELNLWAESKDLKEILLNDLIEKGEIHNVEFSLKTKSGKIATMLSSNVIINLNNKTCRIVTCRDITKEKKMEAEMARLERLNLIGEMAAGISHEVRNPMTTIKGFLQLLKEKKECSNYREYFDLMISELDRANSIISEFLFLAKNKAIDLEIKDLNEILKSLLPLITASGLVTDKYIGMETQEIPELLLDEKEIRQLVLNLARNGLEAVPPGGIISIRTYAEADEVVLSVRDNGKGIEPQVLEKIGTPFFTTKENGIGLGLAVCYSIAARHKARIDIETGPEGTAFLVRFKKHA